MTGVQTCALPIYSVWLTSEEDDEIVTRFKITAKQKKGLNRKIVEIKPGDLVDIFKDIAHVANDLLKFMDKVKKLGIISFHVLERT